MTAWPDDVAASSALSTAAVLNWLSSSNVPTSILGRFLWALGPNVSAKVSVSIMWDRWRWVKVRIKQCWCLKFQTFRVFGLDASSSRAIGNLFLLNSTEYGSSFLEVRPALKCSNAVCEITLVFPVGRKKKINHQVFLRSITNTYQTSVGQAGPSRVLSRLPLSGTQLPV